MVSGKPDLWKCRLLANRHFLVFADSYEPCREKNSGKAFFFIPEIFTCFALEVFPLRISTWLLETANSFAKSLTSSAFAAPSTGGAFNFTFNALSYSPTISLFDERGITRTEKIRESSFSVKSIIYGKYKLVFLQSDRNFRLC